MRLNIAFSDVQALYFIPSVHQHPPKGKLYCRVNNILAMQRNVEGIKLPRKRGRTTEGGGYEYLEFLDLLPDGMVTSWRVINVLLPCIMF